MPDLILVLISGEVMEQNIERSLSEGPEQPWAFSDWKRQMQALQPGRAIVFVDMVDDRGRQVNRFTAATIPYTCRRAIVGTLTSTVERAVAPFFEGYPFEFHYELQQDQTFSPPTDLDGLARWLDGAIPGVGVGPEQLRELIIHSKSNKIGVFIDGAARRASYFEETSPPAAVSPPPAKAIAPRDERPVDPPTGLAEAIDAFAAAVQRAGLVFLGANEHLPRAFLAALVAKRFAILSGLSGSGKTRLAQALGQWLGRSEDGRSRYLVVPVRPDWTSPDSLLGYEDALLPADGGRRAWTAPDALRFMLRASEDPSHLYLLVLDEMNLAHVERYFADVLSGMESGEPIMPTLQLDRGFWRMPSTDARYAPFPPNLLVVGTVNVDETTYQFSPKVLDRAFSFDFRVSTDELGTTLGSVSPVDAATAEEADAVWRACIDSQWHRDDPGPHSDEARALLLQLHTQLTGIGFEFGHRTFHEAMRFVAALAQARIIDTDETVDWVVMTKILPRLHGSRRLLEPFLEELHRSATGSDPDKPAMPLTARRVDRMLSLVRANQFVSFAE